MGAYTYTLRAATRVIDGVEIGHYGYAFKNGWDWHYDSPIPAVRRRVRSLFSKADDAAYKNRNVRHFIGYPFEKIVEGEPAPVFLTETVIETYVETLPGAVLAGHIHREGRSLRFIPKEL